MEITLEGEQRSCDGRAPVCDADAILRDLEQEIVPGVPFVWDERNLQEQSGVLGFTS